MREEGGRIPDNVFQVLDRVGEARAVRARVPGRASATCSGRPPPRAAQVLAFGASGPTSPQSAREAASFSWAGVGRALFLYTL